MAFTIDVQDQDSVSAIVLSGELDMATAPRLKRTIDALLAGGQACILVDLFELSFCDSAGLNTFVQADKHCAARGGWLRLIRAQGHVARVMEISGVGEVLAYHHTVADGADPDRCPTGD